MPIVEPYRVEYTVRGYDCGYGGPLKIFSLTNFFQEAAGAHASFLGIGMETLAARGRTWMLSRIDFRVDVSPAPGDRVEVLTWPAGTKGIFALRDILLRDTESRAVLARAVLAYLVVDLAARRPLRPERCFGFELPRGADPHPVPDFDFSIPETPPETAPGLSGLSFAMQAAPRHIDYNGHVNNAYLVDWLADALPRALRPPVGTESSEGHEAADGSAEPGALRENPAIRAAARQIAVMKVAFDAELLEGDTVDARWSVLPGEGGTLSSLLRGGETVARALTIRPSTPKRQEG